MQKMAQSWRYRLSGDLTAKDSLAVSKEWRRKCALAVVKFLPGNGNCYLRVIVSKIVDLRCRESFPKLPFGSILDRKAFA